MGRKPLASNEEKMRIGKAVHDYIIQNGCSIAQGCLELEEKYGFNRDQLYKFRREYLQMSGQWPLYGKKLALVQSRFNRKGKEQDAESSLKSRKPFDDDQFYSTAQLMRRLNVSRPTLYRAERSGTLPKPDYVGTAKRWHGAKLNKVFAS